MSESGTFHCGRPSTHTVYVLNFLCRQCQERMAGLESSEIEKVGDLTEDEREALLKVMQRAKVSNNSYMAVCEQVLRLIVWYVYMCMWYV